MKDRTTGIFVYKNTKLTGKIPRRNLSMKLIEYYMKDRTIGIFVPGNR
jgi:hypothetical protein